MKNQLSSILLTTAVMGYLCLVTAQAQEINSLANAARSGDLNKVKSMTGNGANLEQKDDFFREETGLVGAARNGHLEVVR